MNVPSSISSSSRRIPQGHWLAVLAIALIALVLVICAMEFRLAARGFEPTIIDSQALWIKQRERASALGANALVLLGNSRMQLDLDTATLRSQTRLSPVQLAIDNSSFVPILAGLARDPSIRGTVLVAYSDKYLANPVEYDAADQYQIAFDSAPHFRRILDFAASEAWLTNRLHGSLRSYADGARPVSSLLLRILDARATPQYLAILPDRSRRADYRRVDTTDLRGSYYTSVIRILDSKLPVDPTLSASDAELELRRRIATLMPEKGDRFDRALRRIDAMVKAIQSRGGRVIFVVLPTSGLVTAADNARYPRTRFWNRFVASTTAGTLHFEDLPSLRGYTCPDGSHLDARDTKRFTSALVKAIGLDGSPHGAAAGHRAGSLEERFGGLAPGAHARDADRVQHQPFYVVQRR